MAFNLAALYWIAWITPAGMVASAAILSLYTGAFLLLLNLIVRRFGDQGLAAAPFLWTAIEYLRSFDDLAFPWTLIGNTQTYYLPLIQYAEITGVYGVSFWIVSVNLLIFLLVKNTKGRRRSVLLSGGIALSFLLPFLYGTAKIPKGRPGGAIKAAIVQPNVPIPVKWGRSGAGVDISLNILRKTSVQASQEALDLIVWPETAVPTNLRGRPKYRDAVHALVDSLEIPILTGAPDYIYETKETYNAAFLFRPGRRDLIRYDKIHLVPVSERMPYVDLIPLWVWEKINWETFSLNFGPANFSRGKTLTIFELPKSTFAVLICFESVFPDLVRQFVQREAKFLVNITNDAWFGRTSSPFQHARIAVFRAIENRIPIVRCANTGVSMFIDPFGRTSQVTKIFEPALIIETIPLHGEGTFFTRYGNLFSKICVVIAGLALLLAAVSKYTLRKADPRD